MRLVLVLDCHDPGRLAQFWAEAIGYRQSSSAGPYLVLVPRHGDGPELVLQRVPEPKTTKNRMHLDIRTGQLGPTIERLTALVARQVQPGLTEEAGFRWVVMADPEGNGFCVCTEPRPVHAPHDRRSSPTSTSPSNEPGPAATGTPATAVPPPT